MPHQDLSFTSHLYLLLTRQNPPSILFISQTNRKSEMKHVRYLMAWLNLLTFSALTWAAQNTQSINTHIPPSAKLTYTVKAEYNGLNLNGNASVYWKADKLTYSIQNEAKISLLGKILDADSNGKIATQGLLPEKYIEKRLRKTQATTLFNYTDHTITFPENKTAPLKKITQDRASIVWQLASAAKADPKHLVPGATLTFEVAGHSKTEPWTFHVVSTDDLATPIGQIKAIQLSRNGKKGQKMDVWLSPEHHWYPVQILFKEQGGLQLLQTIQAIDSL